MRKVPINGWRECGECRYIFQGLILTYKVASDELDEAMPDELDESIPQLPPQPCPACGSTANEPWYMPDSLDDWLITVDETVASCDADRDRIGAVFVASACEAMLRDIIEFGLQQQSVSPKLILYLIDRADGRNKLCELYNAVATNRIASVLEEADLRPWFDKWGRLAKVRNKYAHGKQVSEELADAIHEVACHMGEAFVTLRNAVLIPKSTTESIGISATLRDKLVEPQ